MLGLWTAAFFLPRWAHVEELYCRPYLRSPSMVWSLVGDPIAPAALVRVGVAIVVVGSVLFAAGIASRRVGLAVAITSTLLFFLDYSSPRAYGTLAVAQWWLLFAALAKAFAPDGGWWTGRTIHNVLLSPRFGQFLVSEWVEPTAAISMGLGWGVVVLELSVPFAL